MVKTKKNLIPKLKPIDKTGKRYHYRLSDPFTKRKRAINEGVLMEVKRRKITQKKAAQNKKARFNVLRIYRRYNNPAACRKITHDIRYMDKKYKLGKTKNICNKKR